MAAKARGDGDCERFETEMYNIVMNTYYNWDKE
jgi:hypothetical protein